MDYTALLLDYGLAEYLAGANLDGGKYADELAANASKLRLQLEAILNKKNSVPDYIKLGIQQGLSTAYDNL